MVSEESGADAYEAETRGLRVIVIPEYLEDQSDPDEPRHVWAYHVRLENDGDDVVQLESRYWRIVDGNGTQEEVRGPGVVGEQPILKPGDAFHYSSGCPLRTPSGFMQGHYVMRTEAGDSFEAEIPAFSLDLPDARQRMN